ncbi:hypothetical protein LPY66_04865 [Dehalobacter sp. DCM]|uniref:LolA family protein n=1 Tax=Dehalobacter sp. DCM TaxID=2907827 RepID=UPI003081A611|nr:hypothetical protein LPY66_04865 [Dehalobacter sp. DCM]
MSQRKISLVYLLVIILLCAGILSGCGGGKTADQNQSSSSQSATSTPKQTQTVKDDKTIVAELISKGQTINEMSYELVMVGDGTTADSKVWYKNKKMKAETTMNGVKGTSYFDFASGECITIMQNMAFKVKIPEYEGVDNATPLDYANGLTDTAYTVNGTETVNGMKCRVITVSSEEFNAKEWINEENGMIVKVQQEVDGKTITMEFKNIKIGTGTVPDSTFDLPSGVEVMDMNDLMNQAMPEAE